MKAFDIMDALNDVDEKLLDGALEDKKTKSAGKYLKIALMAAVAAALLIGAAIAASSDGFLSELFGESYDIIGDYVMMEPISAENEHARITVESSLSDGFNAFVVFSVERLDGGSMEGMFADMEIDLEYSTDMLRTGGFSLEPFETGMETESKRWFLLVRHGDTGLVGARFRLFGVENLETREKADFGEIKLYTEFKQSPVKVGGPGGEPMGDKLYTRVILSPLGLRAQAWTNMTPLTTDGSGSSQRQATEISSATVIFKDGRVEDLTERTVSRRGSLCDEVYCIFPEPMDIEQAEAVEINGIRFDVKYGEVKELRMDYDSGDGFLKLQREYVYRGNEPVYPKMSAESENVFMELESIWTDGCNVGLFLYMESESSFAGLNPMPYEFNGLMEVTALDEKGEKMAVFAELVHLGKLEDGRFLEGYIVRIAGEAETLLLDLDGAEMSIPLNMRKLKRMPQGLPYEEPPKEIDKDNKSDIYKDHYDHLFGNVDLPRVDISADNGEFSITVEYMRLFVDGGGGEFKAMVRMEQLDGEDYDLGRSIGKKELEVGVVFDGSYREATFVGGGFGLNWSEDNVRYSAADMDFEFRSGARDTLRLTWTPPDGERIVLDIPIDD